jgi:hypothetical protein
MSFQWIIDNAESISINRKKIVGATTARDGTTRAVSRGGQLWRFDVKLPDGPRWTDYRQFISQAEALDRTTSANIQLNDAGHRWLIGYQGNSVNYTGFVASITQGSSTITLTTSPSTPGGTYKFRAGDIIQLGSSGKVYTVTADVVHTSNTVTLHRPVIESSATGVALRVAENCVWNVICVQFPEWTLFARDQVSWSGPFIFAENLV